MPLSDTPFNRAKSDLKFIEAAACRVASLASSVVYGDSIEDGRTGLLFRDPAEFHVRLLRLVALPELARDIGDAGRRHVAEHRMLAYQVASADRLVPVALGAAGGVDRSLARADGDALNQPAASPTRAATRTGLNRAAVTAPPPRDR